MTFDMTRDRFSAVPKTHCCLERGSQLEIDMMRREQGNKEERQ